MRYLGGKSAQAKSIALILEQHRKGRVFLEPFCGACNVTVAMSGERIASDLHEELIAMWQAVQSGWQPPTSISEAQYYDIKHNSTDKALRAFVGFACAFGGDYFGTFARGGMARTRKQGRVVCYQKRNAYTVSHSSIATT